MRILISGARSHMKKHDLDHHPHIGDFITPRNWSVRTNGTPFAVDNGCYKGFYYKSWIKMLDRLVGSRPMFVVVPDVLENAQETRYMFNAMQCNVAGRRFPPAYVLQDGQELLTPDQPWRSVPWDYIHCLFIGGSTEYKLGRWARYYVKWAKYFGKHVHMGRVNSAQRIHYARMIGCDTIDGSGLSRFPTMNLPRVMNELKQETFQW